MPARASHQLAHALGALSTPVLGAQCFLLSSLTAGQAHGACTAGSGGLHCSVVVKIAAITQGRRLLPLPHPGKGAARARLAFEPNSAKSSVFPKMLYFHLTNCAAFTGPETFTREEPWKRKPALISLCVSGSTEMRVTANMRTAT